MYAATAGDHDQGTNRQLLRRISRSDRRVDNPMRSGGSPFLQVPESHRRVGGGAAVYLLPNLLFLEFLTREQGLEVPELLRGLSCLPYSLALPRDRAATDL
jgi:hypothetical protein